MDWITAVNRAIDYVETHLEEELDYTEIAAQAFSSAYHFQRVFGILCGMTLGQYIRGRRLTQAGAELALRKIRVIDAAMKYGYESVDGFTRAFIQFHGIRPSEARRPGSVLKELPRLSVQQSFSKGGCVMEYRIEEKPKLTVLGVRRRFEGAVCDRYDQQHDFMKEGAVRYDRYALSALAGDPDTEYCVVSGMDDTGYDFMVGNVIAPYYLDHLDDTIGAANRERLCVCTVPEALYAVVETERSALSILSHLDLRNQFVREWQSTAGYEFSDAPEITVMHHDSTNKDNSFIELWLPIQPRERNQK